ncbi:hypothetical protein [Paenibacillus sp. FSL K6-2524]|uniref:hypothetical protein n=1 Tax=Paenibacillus sp. FSL K6-2524 TaxID=2954516 RepID=UPI0030F6B0C9
MTDVIQKAISVLYEEFKNRDAMSSFNGYYYQFELTLLHLLKESYDVNAFDDKITTPTYYEVEKIEDYIKYFEDSQSKSIRFAQMKHHENYAGESKYHDAILWFYYIYLRLEIMQIPDIDYKFIIFFCDKAKKDNKEVASTLCNALEDHKLKEEQLPDEKRGASLYAKIIELENQLVCTEPRNKFCGISRYIKTPNITDIINEVQEILFSRYNAMNSRYNREFLHAAAITKLIEDARNKKIIELSSLDEYFEKSMSYVNQEYYKHKIMQLIESISEAYINQVFETHTGFFGMLQPITEEDKGVYLQITQDLKWFLISQFEDGNYRKSFLYTLRTDPNEPLETTLDEYETYLKNRVQIASFFAKIIKIMFFYIKTVKKSIKLEEWFQITNSYWLFAYPDEERGFGVIFGDPIESDSLLSTLGYLRNKFSAESMTPAVWYLGRLLEGSHTVKASTLIPYKGDITKYRRLNGLTPCKPGQYFAVQCLGCLKTTDYAEISNVSNIFKANCFMEG